MSEQDRRHYELVVIGAGPGGYVAAIRAAQLGIECAVVESREVGGTCLNRGCIPTKTLVHSSDLLAEIREAASIGINAGDLTVDYPALRARKDEVASTMREGVEGLLTANKVTLLRGRATVAAGRVVEVALNDGTQVTLEADNLIIASGSKPAKPPIEGIDLPGVHTSDTLLAEVPELDSLVIIGGGVIGMEFANIYAAFGTQVTVLEMAPRVLPPMDREFGQKLTTILRKRGLAIHTSAAVKQIAAVDDGGFAVSYELKGQMQTANAQAVLVSTGRWAQTDGLFAEGFELEMNRGRIVVDAHMRTSEPHVYAIGDVVDGGIQLAHAASAQGIAAVDDIAGVPCGVDLSLIPSCVYTTPEIASVGMTEAEAKDNGIKPRVGKFAMGGNGKSLIAGEQASFIKVVADENDKLIGAQIMCGRATDMIGELAVGIANGLTVRQMADVVRAHPTYEEAVGEAFHALLDGPIHAKPARRR